MMYVVQENTFREKHYDALLTTLQRFGFEYEVIKFIPFAHDFWTIDGRPFHTDRKDIFCFGATMMSEAAMKFNWNPGSLMNKNHDVEVYGKYYDLLNNDGITIEIGDSLPLEDDLFFARPTKDTKAFSGQLFTRAEWDQWMLDIQGPVSMERPGVSILQSLQERGHNKVLIAPLKEIYQEIRTWVVGGQVVSISQYKIGSRVVYENLDFQDEEAKEFAQSQVDKFQVAEAFCLDICRTNEGFRVVEVNCLSSAGFYEVNMQKLLLALEDHFGQIKSPDYTDV